jgi:hypothetical protein
MARRTDGKLPSNNRHGTQRDDPDRVDAEALVGDTEALASDGLEFDIDATALSDGADEEDELIIEVELFDEDERGDTEK